MVKARKRAKKEKDILDQILDTIDFLDYRRMKNFVVILAAITMMFGGSARVFSQKNWDKNLAKNEAAVLHFGSSVELEAVDGVKKAIGPIFTVFKGNGGTHHLPAGKTFVGSDYKAKAIIRIPPGERELTFTYPAGVVTFRTTVKYDFAPGRRYFFAIDDDKSAEKAKEKGLDALKNPTMDVFEANVWEIRDVTGEKWAK